MSSPKVVLGRSSSEIDRILSIVPGTGYIRLNLRGTVLSGNLDSILLSEELDHEKRSGKSWQAVLRPSIYTILAPHIQNVAMSRATEECSLPGYKVIVTPHGKSQTLVVFTDRQTDLSVPSTFPPVYEVAASEFRITIYDWDVQHNMILWTAGLTELFGYSQDLKETSDDWWIDCIHPEDRQHTLQLINAHLDRGKDFAVEYRFRGSDGTYRVVLDRGRILKNPDASLRVVGNLIDISEQRNAEIIMRESEKRYRGLVETMHEFVSELDLTGRLRFVNRTFQVSTGYERSELIGKNLLDFVHPEDRDQFTKKCLELVQSRSSIRNCEFRLRKRDGSYFHLLTNADPIYSSQETLEGILQVSFDITERKGIESSMQMLIEVLVNASEAEDLHQVISSSIENICVIGDWQAGQSWLLDEAKESLLCSHSSYSHVDISEFRRVSLQTRYRKGQGLPGRVWETMAPVFLEDISGPNDFTRLQYAKKCGLISAFAFPLYFDHSLLAIFEFFSSTPKTKAERIVEIADKLGKYLGMTLDRKSEQAKLHHQAYHDVLTGLPNRILLQDRFQQALAHARRNQVMLSVLFIDLDEFKPVNDRLGHQMGDLLLREVAGRIGGCLREVDTLARLGGDEFVVLLPDIQLIENPAKVAQKILNLFDGPFQIDEHEINLSTSIGISLYPLDGDSLQVLMKNADMALYRAKEKGRNNYQLYTPAMTVTAVTRLKIEKDLRHAIERKELLLHYQPILHLETGQITGVEALLRWQHPEMGLFLPAEFLPASEESGLISEIWSWALETACGQFLLWKESGISPEYISMNVPSNMITEDARSIVSGIISRLSFPPSCLQLELSERMLMPSQKIVATLQSFRSMGIRLALDDFGAGAATFLHLKNFPIQTFKIDPLFIQGLSEGSRDAQLVNALIALGHGLRMIVVAEGVETQEQLTCLKMIHCDSIQGFLFCRPVSAEVLTPLLADGVTPP